jgi:hypothetical protein
MEHADSMNKQIVITSIYPPTEAIEAFANMPGYKLLVVGDKKTPPDWHYENVEYLPVSVHENTGTHLNKVLPFNHYSRKMIGYLHAIANGADVIIDTDDDNIPKEHWCFPGFEGAFDYIRGDQGFVNVYQLYTDAHIWPRGLPLQLITKKFNLGESITNQVSKVGMWQGLADEDPDVDAIYRLTSDTPVYFNNRAPVVLGRGTISPFNTQNTIIRKELFPLMYLPTYVTFRFTDILRGYIAQPIMWLNGYHLGFVDATVVQKRNPHDYVKDFVSEIPMYKHCEEVMEITAASISAGASIADNMYNTYSGLLKRNIVEERELEVLTAWLRDIE